MASFSKLQVRDGRHVRLGERVDLEPASLQTEDGPWALGCLGGGVLDWSPTFICKTVCLSSS